MKKKMLLSFLRTSVIMHMYILREEYQSNGMHVKPLTSKQEHRIIKVLESLMRFPEQYLEFFTEEVNVHGYTHSSLDFGTI